MTSRLPVSDVPLAARHSKLPFSILLILAWRNIWRQRRRTLITLSSIAFGFGLAVFFIGLGDGGHNSMIRNAINLGEGHITIQPRGYLEAPGNHKFLANGKTLLNKIRLLTIPGHVEQRISLQVLASTANNSVAAALEGINNSAAGELADNHKVTNQRIAMLKPHLSHGEWATADDKRGIMIGAGMAAKLKAEIGSKIVLMAGDQQGDTQAQLGRVRGIFTSGVDELDDYLVVSNLSLATLFIQGEGADLTQQPLTRLAVFLDDSDVLLDWKKTLQQHVADEHIVVLDWQEMMPQLVQFILIDDAGNYVFLILILILVVFGILNTVLMSVLERTREFGLLRALGLGRIYLLLLVFCESLLLSVLAVLVGWIVGGGVHWWFSQYGINMSALMAEGTAVMGTFMDPVIYTELSWSRVIQLTSLIFIVTLLTGIYPALKAARATPVEALRS